jgi:hypothetical protein
MRRLTGAAFLAAVTGCVCGGGAPPPPGRFGELTTAVIIVNPRINQGSTTGVTPGTARANVTVTPGDLAPVSTDSTGLAVAQGLPSGQVPLKFDSGSYGLGVVASGDLYDVVLAYRGSGVEAIVPPVRYPIGGQVKTLEPGADIAAAATANSVLLLRAGSYPGNFELTSDGVLIFGDWSPIEGNRSIIDGSVTVRGGGVRIRGVRVTGKLTANANSFSAAFCDLGSANITGNGVSLIRNKFVTGSAAVPSSNATLVDNEGIP